MISLYRNVELQPSNTQAKEKLEKLLIIIIFTVLVYTKSE